VSFSSFEDAETWQYVHFWPSFLVYSGLASNFVVPYPANVAAMIATKEKRIKYFMNGTPFSHPCRKQDGFQNQLL